MTVGDALRELAKTVDAIDERGVEVVRAVPDETGDDEVIADLRVRIPMDEETEAAPEPTDDPDAESGEPGADATSSEPDDTGMVRSTPADPALDEGPVAGDSSTGADGDTDTGSDVTADEDPGSDESTTATDVGATDADLESGDGTEPASESTADPEAEDDGAGVTCTSDGCTEQFDTEHGMRIHRSKVHDGSTSRRDRGTLASVYEAHDSFAEMREALDVDVSVQTVRRWMIDHDIHSPTGFRSANADDAGDAGDDTDDAAEPTGETDAESDGPGTGADDRDPGPDAGDVEGDPETGDGNGEETGDEIWAASEPTAEPEVDVELPSSVTAGELRDAVEEATTLYEVQKRLDLGREEVRDLLSELDLLELVHGRVATKRRREELKSELDERFGASGGHAESSSD